MEPIRNVIDLQEYLEEDASLIRYLEENNLTKEKLIDEERDKYLEI